MYIHILSRRTIELLNDFRKVLVETQTSPRKYYPQPSFVIIVLGFSLNIEISRYQLQIFVLDIVFLQFLKLILTIFSNINRFEQLVLRFIFLFLVHFALNFILHFRSELLIVYRNIYVQLFSFIQYFLIFIIIQFQTLYFYQ